MALCRNESAYTLERVLREVIGREKDESKNGIPAFYHVPCVHFPHWLQFTTRAAVHNQLPIKGPMKTVTPEKAGKKPQKRNPSVAGSW